MDVAARVERKWAIGSVTIIVILVGLAAFAGIHQATMPQARVETVDPRRLHIEGEFVESNLGSSIESDGSVTVRIIGQQYSFTPQCILVPTQTPVTFRATSADAVHGFLINQTNINTMLVPGYVSVLRTRFEKPGDHLLPCHEFCGIGHAGMWANVKVIEKSAFLDKASHQQRLSCVE